MICPTCKTNNTDEQGQFCVQCGSDLHVYRLLREINKEIQMKGEIIKPEHGQMTTLFVISRTVPSVIMLICAIFAIFVGMRFLAFLDNNAAQRVILSDKWSQSGFEQLQQMNSTIRQELDLILEQHRENISMQAKILELTDAAQKNKIQELTNLIQHNKSKETQATEEDKWLTDN